MLIFPKNVDAVFWCSHQAQEPGNMNQQAGMSTVRCLRYASIWLQARGAIMQIVWLWLLLLWILCN